MEIKEQKNSDVQDVVGDFGSTEATISDSSFPFLFRMLSQGLYSNPIGSICREITSNCFDSHVEANVDDPVVITRGHDVEGEYISFKDVGIGLSPMRMLKIYMKYFSSTKRKTNTLIGGFGLGSKTPLSYTDSFYITSIKNGKKYEYLYSKGETKPTLDCLTGHEEKSIAGNINHKIVDGISLPVIPEWKVNWPVGEETSERNGSEIKIYIKSGDYTRFYSELKSQLCYFDNVYFNSWGIDNNYKIYENDLYKFRNKDQYSDEMHICFGKVSYPIDWKQINLDPIEIPVGVKFKIGELVVTPNRESLQYTDEVKALVRERILACKEHLIKTFNEQNKPIDNFKQWYQKRKQRAHIEFETEEGLLPDTLFLKGIKDIDKTHRYTLYGDAEIFYDMDNPFSNLYIANKSIHAGKEEKYIGNPEFTNSYIRNSRKYSIGSFHCSAAKNAYFNYGYLIKRELNTNIQFHQLCVNIHKENRKTVYNSRGYIVRGQFGDGHSHFRLGSAYETWEIVKCLRFMFELDCCKDYNDVPEDFVKKFNDDRRNDDASYQRKKQGKIFCKRVNRNSEFEISLRQIERFKGVIIYGGRDDYESLKKAVTFMRNFESFTKKHSHYSKNFYPGCEIIIVAKQNHKHFNKPNMVHVDNLYSDNKLFRKIASAFKIKNFLIDLSKYQDGATIREFIAEVSKINSDIAENISILKLYLDRNLKNKGSEYDKNDSIESAITEVAEKYNLFDESIEETIKYVKNWFDGAEILKFTEINNKSIPYILKYLKNQGKRINNCHYLKVVMDNESIFKEEFKEKQIVLDNQVILLFPELEEKPKQSFKVLTEDKIAS